MSFGKDFHEKRIANQIQLNQKSEVVWKAITNVSVSKAPFSIWFVLLGIPKPLSAEVKKEGIGGYRVAHFSNGAQFHQEILDWDLYSNYRFSFNPTENFRVGHFWKLSKGPFSIETGGYKIEPNPTGCLLTLSSTYELHGTLGALLHIPFRLIVHAFQKHLLKGIKKQLNQ